MFDKILIANRGEIALRVLRAAKELGIATVAVYSTADKEAMHVKLADESVCIGPPPARESYLNVPALLAACEITGADAVHPGYGFLAENARFADILAEHGIAFIGPKAEHIRLMGDKIEAKRTAARLGIPCVPGSAGAIADEAEAVKVAAEIGYPVLVKAAAGGGGRGMRVANSADELADALANAKMEAKAAFGDDAVYLEKYLAKPRHIEFQVLGDGKGRAIHLGERDCSLQRRHQKVWEEGPSPALNAAQREEIGGVCARAMAELGYVGVGTIEFLFENGGFYFIEMNTRIQVEHPVTEMITGIDLVNEQIKIAAGSPLSIAQEDVRIQGAAIECRLNAEHPGTFMPSPGRISYFHPPGGLGVRVDSAAYQGYVIPPYYDSLIGKLIVHGRNRTEALMRLRRALDEFVVEGVETTLPLYRTLVRNLDVQNGQYDIHWLEGFLESDEAKAARA
ncbi:MAG: acetyl-CoA carboxylase biotin carboxylase subunit [Roseiarcus sp.]|jgi:acetyl-CoA carboxylase biotin carboxylase subunit|uniref:acetyl-CoA carboxylase biotin carboxylase subunit n=1 Tax=Roseiarcus sp. TaxID=1969460 RepID=UPI003C138B8B